MNADISIFNFATGEYETGIKEMGPQHVPQHPTVQNLYRAWIALGLSPELAALRCLESWIGIPHDETVGST